MNYKVFIEAKTIVLIEAESKEEAAEKALAGTSYEMEWNAEIIEETE